MRKIVLSLFFAGFLFAEETLIDLRNPTYRSGILYTSQGGVIQNEDLRIQARTIQYTKRTENGKEVHKIEAEGDLLIQYKGRAYVGSELEYDFTEKSGIVYDGCTFSTMWFVSGEQIELKPDGSYKVKNASITTCENKDSSWDLHARNVHVLKEDLFEAKKLRFRLFKIPLVWIPSFKLNLKKFKEPVFRYTLNWDKGQGPRASIRYQLYSWQDFAFYGRLSYRWRTGWGGALETEYFPPHKDVTFVTQSYIGSDRLETAPDKMQRYRLLGALNAKNEHTRAILTWDKYNDVRMPTVFKTEDFEVSTAGKTLFYLQHWKPDFLTSLKVRPRVNTFESIQQDLPTLYARLFPQELGHSGLYNNLLTKASYLSFDYSHDLTTYLRDFRSARVEVRDTLYRPIFFGPVTLTPFFGGEGIFYSNSPSGEQKSVGLLLYGASLITRLSRTFSTQKHIIEPYASFTALTRPSVPPDAHYIFSIADGYNKINQIRAGFRSLLLSPTSTFTADLNALAFFSDPVIPQFIPHLFLDLSWKLPNLFLHLHNNWNFQNQVLDDSRLRFRWTLSEDLALTFEGRYRSRFHWRKADHENYILDVTRPQTELLLSPLSDRRITFLASAFLRITPLWDAQISFINGFFRLNEDPYTEVKVDLSTWINSSMKVRLSYNHIRYDDRVSFHLDLVKK